MRNGLKVYEPIKGNDYVVQRVQNITGQDPDRFLEPINRSLLWKKKAYHKFSSAFERELRQSLSQLKGLVYRFKFDVFPVVRWSFPRAVRRLALKCCAQGLLRNWWN